MSSGVELAHSVGQGTLTEGFVVLVLATALLWPVRAHLSSLFRSLTHLQQAGSVSMAILLVAGQALDRGTAMFPWVSWSMYSVARTSAPEFIDYTVIRASGREERLLLGRASGLAQIRPRLDDRALAVSGARTPQERARESAELDELLRALARGSEPADNADRIRVVRVWRCTIPRTGFTGPASIERELVSEVPLP